MPKHSNLTKAKSAKNDEFYTQLTDVSNELMHYKQHFKDKIVLCNCDDPTWSAFWKYFHLNFSVLGLKKLISTRSILYFTMKLKTETFFLKILSCCKRTIFRRTNNFKPITRPQNTILMTHPNLLFTFQTFKKR